jgi:hypothetical protein
MRTTLITGLLLCLPTAVLLASVSLAVLAGRLRRLTRSQFSDLPTAGPDREELRDDFSDLPTAGPDREELRDDVTPASAGRLYASPHEAPARGPCCQTPIAFPAGSRVIATHRSPSG